MSNLLPQEEKETIKRDYRLRLSALSGFFISILLLISGIVFSAYILLLRSEFGAIQKDINLAKENQEEKELKTIVEETNNELGILSFATDPFSFKEVTDILFMHQNDTISISYINFGNDAKKIFLDIKGIAKTRDGLIAFLQSVEKDTRVSLLDSPISNLSKNANITFSAHIELKQHEGE